MSATGTTARGWRRLSAESGALRRSYRCDYCGGYLTLEVNPEGNVVRRVEHDHSDDSPDSSLTAEIRYARRGDY